MGEFHLFPIVASLFLLGMKDHWLKIWGTPFDSNSETLEEGQTWLQLRRATNDRKTEEPDSLDTT